MATSHGHEKHLIHLINNLIALDFDAIDAYQAAIQRLTAIDDREQLTAFMRDHQRHTGELMALVRANGGEPATQGDFKRLLTKGKVVLAGLVDDRAILYAMKTNEDDTNIALERALRHEGLTHALRDVLERNLGDERRHRAWLEARLESYAHHEQPA